MDKEEKKNILDIAITSDIELENTWLFDIIKESGIDYLKTYVHSEFLYEVEYLPTKNKSDYLFKYTFHYDLDNDLHNFTRFLINKYGEIVFNLDYQLEVNKDEEKTTEE